MDIFSPQDNKLFSAPVTQEAERVQELMKSDYIKLSWRDNIKKALPVGSYINYDGIKFSLLDEYTPNEVSESEFKYEPEFQHPMMVLRRMSLALKTTNSAGEPIWEYDWNMTDKPSNILAYICLRLNEDFGITNEGWGFQILSSFDVVTATCTFSNTDYLSALAEICNKFSSENSTVEYLIDWEMKQIYLGVNISIGQSVTLKVGDNIQTPSISLSKEGYYNRFIVKGSSRNIWQRSLSGESVSTNARLSLDKNKYPNGYIDKAKQGEPILTKVLVYDEIYPKLDLYAYDVRERNRYLLDDGGKKVVDHYDNAGKPVHKTYSVWYIRLAYPVYNTDKTVKEWRDFKATKDLVLDGYTLMAAFVANEQGSHSALSGRDFKMYYHTASETFPKNAATGDTGVEIKAGDYEINFNKENGDIIIPTTSKQGLVPWGEKTPSLLGDKVVLYNLAMSDEYLANAQRGLEAQALKDIAAMFSDNNNYSFKSNPAAFEKSNPNLYIGRSVTYEDINGYKLSTRVTKLTTKLDFSFQQEITVGNAHIKGNTQTLKEDVKSANENINILSALNSAVSAKSDAYYRALQTIIQNFSNIGEDVKTKLSKLSPDTAQGLITFLKGIAFKDKYGISGQGEAVLKSMKLDGAEIDQSGHGTFTGITNLGDIVTKNLTVTGMMHIFTLVIDKVKSAGGAAIFTPADGFTVDKVEPAAGGYRLYWRATDGNGLARDNMWEAGDQALCHTDNRMRAGTAHNASNKLYWCLVTKTGTGIMADISGMPTECNYIDISTSDKLAGCVVNPETGDSIVMLGHRGDNKRRKSAIYISAHSSLDPTLQAPLIAQYADIDSFDISGKATSSLAFDASKGRTMLKVNGDAYIGDGNDNFIRYTPEHGLEVSAVAHFKAGTTGGENIDGISASGANLIVNSGFTGNYESIEVSESTPVSGETPVFSPSLFGWSGTSIVSKDADSASGFSASLSGAISQAIPTIVPGLPYAFTAKAKGRVITVSVGGVERVFQLSGQYQVISFVAVPAVGESFSMSGDCTVCEPMLVLGRTLAAWQPGAQDNDRSMGELHALRSLTEAIQQSSTRVVGGFVLTQTIKVGNYRNKVLTEETGGMSGYRVSDNSPYIWGGGTLAQAHYTINKYAADPSYQATEEELKKMAKFVVTHGGRAILNDMILRGYVYAEGGVFKNVSSPNGNFMITETGDVKIKGEINASSGKIAGIEIHGNYLGSEIKRDANGNIIPWSGPNGRFGLYSDMISFSSPDGRQVILGTWNNFGVPLMARLSDNRPDFMPKYGIVFDIANSTFGQNYAFIGRGNGILNGVMDSYRYRRLILAEDNTVYNINDPQNGNRVFVFTDKDHTDVSLPKLSAMKVFLGMSADSTEPFSIPLVIMGDLKTKGFSVFGRNDRKVRDKDGKETKPWAGDEYPLIVSYNVAEWLPTVGMAEGDVLEFMLTYDPGRDSESDRIDGKTIVYTARLIRFLQ
jgi:hypothetical protein